MTDVDMDFTISERVISDTPILTPISRPTHDTPEAALWKHPRLGVAALRESGPLPPEPEHPPIATHGTPEADPLRTAPFRRGRHPSGWRRTPRQAPGIARKLAGFALAALDGWTLVPLEWHVEMEHDRALRLSVVKEANAEIARLRTRLASADAAVDAAAEWRHMPKHAYLTELVNRALDVRAAGES